MIDAALLRARTGWDVHHHAVLPSTNDEAARLRDAGAGPRTAVVADAQTEGRGRAGRLFASPPGGLYVSLLVAARPADLPGPLTAAVALAAAEAVEETAHVAVEVKWPNDLWVSGRKAGGILLEAVGPDRPVVAGIGINVRGVPGNLEPAVRAAATCLDEAARGSVPVAALLESLLLHADRRARDLQDAEGRASLEAAWRARLALLGERIRYEFGGRTRHGTFLDASLAEGLLVDEDGAGRVRRRSEHVQDVRPAL